MKLTKTVIKRIEANKYYNQEDFVKDCKTYIKAVQANRALFRVTHVSTSGMSRNISITSFEGKMSKGYFRQYASMLEVMGFNLTNRFEVKASGCGMDMVWNTNYNIVNMIKSYGIITKKTSEKVSQMING